MSNWSRLIGWTIFVIMGLMLVGEYLVENGLLIAARAASTQNAVIDMTVFVILLVLFVIVDVVVLFFGTIIGGSLVID